MALCQKKCKKIHGTPQKNMFRKMKHHPKPLFFPCCFFCLTQGNNIHPTNQRKTNQPTYVPLPSLQPEENDSSGALGGLQQRFRAVALHVQRHKVCTGLTDLPGTKRGARRWCVEGRVHGVRVRVLKLLDCSVEMIEIQSR